MMSNTWRVLLAWILIVGFGFAGISCGGDDDDSGSSDDDTDDDTDDDDTFDDDTDDDADDDTGDDDTVDDDTGDDDTGDDDTGDDDTGDDDTGDDDTGDDDTADDDTGDDDTGDDDTGDDDTADDDTSDDDFPEDDCGVPLDDPIDAGSYTAIPYEYGDASDPDARTTSVGQYFWFADPYVRFVRQINMNSVPLHAVGYYPDGPGPFPLILIVHGNHSASELSYPGYDYLTHQLATHGFIAFSVEEDFLNGGVSGEMDARGIVLLRHLQLFREWNQTSGHTFEGLVDMHHIGLAGHSRGGEAVTVAWQYNTTKHNPSDPLHNFHFHIKSLYAIAPVDGQIGINPVTLRGVDYFIMHGSHDGDVSDFQGHKCFDRAFDPNDPTWPADRGLLFVEGANHGQWNTVWAPGGDPYGVQFSTVPLISAQDQQDIGKIFMTAWFRWTLQGRRCYRHMAAGEVEFPSFPDTPMIRSFVDPDGIFVDHYQEDTTFSTGSYPGATNSQTDLDLYGEQVMSRGQTGGYPGSTRGVLLAWDGPGRYRVDMPATDDGTLADMDTLSMRVGQILEATDDYNTNGTSQDFNVRVVVGGVEGDPVPASDYRDLVSMARVQLTYGTTSMSVLDTLRIPLADLNGGSPLTADAVEAVILEFNQTSTGRVGLDDIQFVTE